MDDVMNSGNWNSKNQKVKAQTNAYKLAYPDIGLNVQTDA